MKKVTEFFVVGITVVIFLGFLLANVWFSESTVVVLVSSCFGLLFASIVGIWALLRKNSAQTKEEKKNLKLVEV